MNKEQDYASDTDESDEDFQPDALAGESAASEDEAEDCESDEGMDENVAHSKKKLGKRKDRTNKTSKMKTNSKHEDESDDDDINTSKRATRQRNGIETNKKEKATEKDELVSDEEDKSRTNALWADFLNDVNSTPTFKEVDPCSNENKSSSSTTAKNNSKRSLAIKSEDKKLALTEVVGVAAEDVCLQKEIDVCSIKENKAATIIATKKQPFSRIMPGAGIKRTLNTPATGSGTGLGSVLNQLGKKKKLSVLEKSQMDWKNFKQSEGIDEQLQTFNKGKDGYLERQDFLQRTDLRQFEIEKNLRQTTRRPH